jgi:15-cis-phytoene synthase
MWAAPKRLDAPGGGLELRRSQLFCQRMAYHEAKNFYWGFISLERDQRIAIYALYDFARQVDDEADIAGTARLSERLAVHRERVHACVRGEYADPVMQVLADAVARYKIPEAELLALIDGVETDLHQTRYHTWPQLQVYCKLVASVVGRMCVRIFGFADAAALDHADELGLALQLTNILRDVREDADLGRIYIPGEDLERFGVVESDLLAGRSSAGWRSLVRFEIHRAQTLFASGLRVADYIPRRAAVCVQTMAGIYHRILDKIERDPELPLRARASLSRMEKLRVVVESWLRSA